MPVTQSANTNFSQKGIVTDSIDYKDNAGRELARYTTRGPVGEVDHEKGIIYGFSVITKGEASGHGEYVDDVMLDQVVAGGEEKEPLGTKARFDHPQACARSMGLFVGRSHNFRRDGDHVRADLHVADVAAKSPDGDLRDYILNLADEDPDAFAASIVFKRDKSEIPDRSQMGQDGMPPEDDPFWLPHVRLAKLKQCDVVDQGAANEGIFGRPEYWAEQAERWAREHPNALGRVMEVYYEWKQKQEAKKMSDQDKKEMEKELSEATQTIEDLTTKLGEATQKIEGHETALETAKTEAKSEGIAEVRSMVKARLEKYKDPKFVVDTIDKTDEEVKDAYIEKLEKGDKATDGTKPVEFDDDTNGDEDTFEDKVQEKTDGGMKRDVAISKCAGEFPKLHKEYIERTNKARNAE